MATFISAVSSIFNLSGQSAKGLFARAEPERFFSTQRTDRMNLTKTDETVTDTIITMKRIW